jgi:Flp pilus assembly pilin Flp
MLGLKRFLKDEAGAVTVDWVVLTAGVVVLAVVVAPPIQRAVFGTGEMIGDTIAEYKKFME